MGGPMYYSRLVGRNYLTGWGYMGQPQSPDWLDKCVNRDLICGELRRMEEDQLQGAEDYAKMAGITKEQAEIVLRCFMGIAEPDCVNCNRSYKRERGDQVQLGRCYEHAVYGRSPTNYG